MDRMIYIFATALLVTDTSEDTFLRCLNLTLHKIAVPSFCRICDKRLAGEILVIDKPSFPVVVPKRRKSSALACLVRLQLQPRDQLLEQCSSQPKRCSHRRPGAN